MKNQKLIKACKISGYTLLILLTLLIILPLFFQKQIADMAVNEANKMLNAKVSIEDFRLSMLRNFPNPTLKLKGVVVENINEFQGDTLLKMNDFMASINLFSLFSDIYQVKKIILKEVTVYLKVNEDTLANWDILKPDTLPEEETKEPSTFNLQFDKLLISKANIHYHDLPSHIEGDIQDFNFTLRGHLSNDYTTLKTSISTKAINLKMDGVPYLSQATFHFKAKIDADLKNSKYTIQDNEMALNALLLQLDGWISMPKDAIEMDLKLKMPKNDFKSITSLIPALYAKDFKNLKADGKVTFSAFAKGKLTNRSYPAFGLQLKIEEAMFQYPTLPASVSHINIDAQVSNKGGSLDNTLIDLNQFHFAIINNPFDLKIHLATPISDPNINIAMTGMVNLGDIKKVYPLNKGEELSGTLKMDLALKGRLSYIEQKAYDKFDAKGALNIRQLVMKNTNMLDQNLIISEAQLLVSSASIHLAKFIAKMGHNDLYLMGKIENYLPYIFKNGTLKGKLSLNSNYLNLNDFLSNQENTNNTPQKKVESKETPTPLALIQVPNNLDITANATIKKLIYDNIQMDQASLSCSIKDSKIKIQNLGAQLFSGNIHVNGYYATPSYNKGNANVSLTINKISTQNLCNTFHVFETFLPMLKNANGNVSVTIDANTVLKETMIPDYATLNMKGIMQMTDIKLGMDELLNKISGALKLKEVKSKEIKDIKFDYEIINGKMHTKPFSFKVGQSNVVVENGTIGLDQSIDYTAVLTMPTSVLGNETMKMTNQLVA
ncbi:MAG: AsmA-like C-terminal region-containing protein, partial [Bacteroidales bacterium]